MGTVIHNPFIDTDGNPLDLSTPIDKMPSGDGGSVTLGDRLRLIEGKLDLVLDAKANKADVAAMASRMEYMERHGSWHVPDILRDVENCKKAVANLEDALDKRITQLEKSTGNDEVIRRQNRVLLGYGLTLIAITVPVLWNTFAIHWK